MNFSKSLRPLARTARAASSAAAAAPRKAYVRKPAAVKPTPSPVAPTPVAAVAAAPRLAKSSPASSFSAADIFDDAGIDDLLPEIPLPPTHASPALTPSSFAAPSTLASTTSSAFPSTSTGFPSGPSIAQTSAPVPTHATVPLEIPQAQNEIDWSTSYHGLSSQPFSERAAALLMRPLLPNEIEIKPDGLLYLPEILYRRILNQAFGPGGWGMVPRGEMTVLKMMVSREWGLVAGGRLVSVARGEQTFFNAEGLPTATEGCKSNALMRCCKDLGIASELWDPAFIRLFKTTHCHAGMTEHASTKKRQQRWRKKGNKFDYPLVEVKPGQ